MNTRELKNQIRNATARSAWAQGVVRYALDLVENIGDWQAYHNADAPTDRKELEKILLNGARDWKQYSEGGCALVYDIDIARALCNRTELRKVKGGFLPPNSRETWIDVQARALRQACDVILQCATRFRILNDHENDKQ